MTEKSINNVTNLLHSAPDNDRVVLAKGDNGLTLATSFVTNYALIVDASSEKFADAIIDKGSKLRGEFAEAKESFPSVKAALALSGINGKLSDETLDVLNKAGQEYASQHGLRKLRYDN